MQEEKPVENPLVSDSDEEIQTPLCSKYISVLRSSLHSFRFVKEEQKEECMWILSQNSSSSIYSYRKPFHTAIETRIQHCSCKIQSLCVQKEKQVNYQLKSIVEFLFIHKTTCYNTNKSNANTHWHNTYTQTRKINFVKEITQTHLWSRIRIVVHLQIRFVAQILITQLFECLLVLLQKISLTLLNIPHP